jgi:hypothetical protein
VALKGIQMPHEVHVQKQGDLVKAWVDGQALSFGPSNQAVIAVSSKAHVITWVALGAPGESYAIQITKPEQAVFSHTGTIDADKKDAGLHWFSVEE